MTFMYLLSTNSSPSLSIFVVFIILLFILCGNLGNTFVQSLVFDYDDDATLMQSQ